MDLARLLLRFILVPLGYFCATLGGVTVAAISSWTFDIDLRGPGFDVWGYGFFGFLVAGPFLFFFILSYLCLPASVGILISEAFAIRTWIYHAANGAVTAFAGWRLMLSFDRVTLPYTDSQYVIAAGLAAGFTYWAIAGWNAGFWKPVFARPAQQTVLPPPVLAQAPALPALPPASPPSDPFNPPAQTKA